MSRARAIFDDLIAGDAAARWARIEKLVTDKEQESLWLDFKEVGATADPNEAYLKEKLARALSGFVNTEGGVLVYGIFAKEGKKGEPDAAEKITPIASPGKFRAALEKLALTITDPVVGGLIVQEIVKPEADEGVVVAFVPESNGAPHRIVSTSEKWNDRYMMRTATSVVVMPHRLLADRFGRGAAPLLQLTARFTSFSPAAVEFRLSNLGRGAARRPAFALVHASSAFQEPILHGRTSTTGFGMRQDRVSSTEVRTLIEGRGDVVIYPGMELFVHRWQTRLSSATGALELDLDVVLYALDMQPFRGSGKLYVGVGESQDEAMARALLIPSAEELRGLGV